MLDLYFTRGNLEALLDLSSQVVHILQERTRHDICLFSSSNVALKYAAWTLVNHWKEGNYTLVIRSCPSKLPNRCAVGLGQRTLSYLLFPPLII